MSATEEANHKKRKSPHVSEIEIDVSAPEPPSKKALRKAKKKGSDTPLESTVGQEVGTVASNEESNNRSEYGIWIGNLPFSATKDDLRMFLTSNCSFTDTAITRLHLPKPSEKNGRAQNKGFAYIDFSSQKAANEAMGLSEKLLSGRRVLIKDAKNYTGRPEKSQDEKQRTSTSGSASSNPPSKRIFVGNLGFDATKEVIEEHFAQCGSVAHVHLATFQDTGKCKGYAWVTFEDLAAAEAAVKGFVMIDEDDEDDDTGSDAETHKKAKKPKQKRVWVNNLLGRRMRMEFAEDATTRYKKRFGKDGEGRKTSDTDMGEANYSESTAIEGQPQPSRPTKTKPVKPEYSRYDQDTVQKLSGAIVESQGKKTTFD